MTFLLLIVGIALVAEMKNQNGIGRKGTRTKLLSIVWSLSAFAAFVGGYFSGVDNFGIKFGVRPKWLVETESVAFQLGCYMYSVHILFS